MIEKDDRLVLVGNTQVGLIGLKEIFEELKREGSPTSPRLKSGWRKRRDEHKTCCVES